MQLAYNLIALVVVIAGWGGVLIGTVLFKMKKLSTQMADLQKDVTSLSYTLSSIEVKIKKLSDAKAPSNGKAKAAKKV